MGARIAIYGDASVSLGYTRQHVSDFGSFENHTLTTLWRPLHWLTLTGSISRTTSAPPATALDEPPVETPNVRYFDPLNQVTVDVTGITGGVQDLRRQRDESKRLAVSVKPLATVGLRVTSEYLETSNRNLITELPPASASIVNAFPDRFIRDAGGRLTIVDARPVSFAARKERQIRSGFILSLPIGRSGTSRDTVAEDDDEENGRPPRATASSVRPRLQVSVSHN